MFTELTSFAVLRRAARRAAANATWRTRGASEWLSDLEARSLALQDDLRAGRWTPGPPTVFQIRDPKPRVISAAPFRDRVVHHAFCLPLEPLFERLADPDSYACRVGKGSHAAVRRLQRLLRRPGNAWYVKVDIRHHFETLPHDRLLARLATWVEDADVLALARAILGPGPRGLPIGSLPSQHFGNFYLGAMDHFARHELRVRGWVRYMDDAIALVDSREAARDVRSALGAFAAQVLGQRLKDEATVLAPVHVGVPFLGFRVWARQIRLDAARKRRLLRRLTALAAADPADAQRRVGSVLAWADLANSRTLIRRGITCRSRQEPSRGGEG